MTSVIQFSIQLNQGRIFVVGGDTPEQFEDNFRKLLGLPPLDLLIADVVNALNATPPSPPAPPQQGPPDFVPSQYRDRMQPPSQWQPQAPMDNGPPEPHPMCRCNAPMKWVPPGNSKKTGNPYPGFFACPRPVGQQCPPPRQS